MGNDIENSEKLYFSIGEVATELGVEPPTIHHWEKKIPQLHPKRSGSSRRLYTKEDVELLKQIYHLRYVEHLSLDHVKLRLETMGDNEQNRIKAVSKLIVLRRQLVELQKRL